MRAPPLPLIEDGRVLWRNLRVELMSERELITKLREHGIENPREVAKAYIEPDGQITVLRKKTG